MPILRPQDEINFVLRFRPPGRRTELEDGGQDGGRIPDPRTKFISSSNFVLQDGGRNHSVLQDGGRSLRTEQIPSSRTEDGI